jgi:hypothetical protein
VDCCIVNGGAAYSWSRETRAFHDAALEKDDLIIYQNLGVLRIEYLDAYELLNGLREILTPGKRSDHF